jgi:hypothetical protein
MQYSKWHLMLPVVTLLLYAVAPVAAQSADPQPEAAPAVHKEPVFNIRSASVSSGYSFVQLPPITLGGYLPSQALENDLITTGAGEVGWRKTGAGFLYDLDLGGSYTGRVKYSQIDGFGSYGSFTVKRSFRRRWSTVVGGSYFLANSATTAFLPTPSPDAVTTTADPLEGAATLARSRNPDPTQAALFVPINQSADYMAAYGQQMFGSGAVANLTYSHSARFSSYLGIGYSSIQGIPLKNESLAPFPSSQTQSVNGGISYSLSTHSSMSAGISRSKVVGAFQSSGNTATTSFDWFGRRWFSSVSAGVGMVTGGTSSPPGIVYAISAGYKTTSQTFVIATDRRLFDPFGYGGVNPETGFHGTFLELTGTWYWSPLRSKWNAHANIGYSRNIGNFSYILGFNSTGAFARQITPTLRGEAQFTFIKQGSRGFEGFYLTREGLLFNLVWLPVRGHHRHLT